jgi:hypothetical protein
MQIRISFFHLQSRSPDLDSHADTHTFHIELFKKQVFRFLPNQAADEIRIGKWGRDSHGLPGHTFRTVDQAVARDGGAD